MARPSWRAADTKGVTARHTMNQYKDCAMNGAPNFIEAAALDDPVAALRWCGIWRRQRRLSARARCAASSPETGSGKPLPCLVSDGASALKPWPVPIHASAMASSPGPGTYETTLTRPDLLPTHYREQFRLLMKTTSVARDRFRSQPLPVHPRWPRTTHIEGQSSPERRRPMRVRFPTLARWDDGTPTAPAIRGPAVDGVIRHPPSLSIAPRPDYSPHRLRHYTGTAAEHFQNFVLFTNYQFLHRRVHQARSCHGRRQRHTTTRPFRGARQRAEPPCAGLAAEPATMSAYRRRALPQMPAYHLVRNDRAGITMP